MSGSGSSWLDLEVNKDPYGAALWEFLGPDSARTSSKKLFIPYIKVALSICTQRHELNRRYSRPAHARLLASCRTLQLELPKDSPIQHLLVQAVTILMAHLKEDGVHPTGRMRIEGIPRGPNPPRQPEGCESERRTVLRLEGGMARGRPACAASPPPPPPKAWGPDLLGAVMVSGRWNDISRAIMRHPAHDNDMFWSVPRKDFWECPHNTPEARKHRKHRVILDAVEPAINMAPTPRRVPTSDDNGGSLPTGQPGKGTKTGQERDGGSTPPANEDGTQGGDAPDDEENGEEPEPPPGDRSSGTGPASVCNCECNAMAMMGTPVEEYAGCFLSCQCTDCGPLNNSGMRRCTVRYDPLMTWLGCNGKCGHCAGIPEFDSEGEDDPWDLVPSVVAPQGTLLHPIMVPRTMRGIDDLQAPDSDASTVGTTTSTPIPTVVFGEPPRTRSTWP